MLLKAELRARIAADQLTNMSCTPGVHAFRTAAALSLGATAPMQQPLTPQLTARATSFRLSAFASSSLRPAARRSERAARCCRASGAVLRAAAHRGAKKQGPPPLSGLALLQLGFVKQALQGSDLLGVSARGSSEHTPFAPHISYEGERGEPRKGRDVVAPRTGAPPAENDKRGDSLRLSAVHGPASRRRIVAVASLLADSQLTRAQLKKGDSRDVAAIVQVEQTAWLKSRCKRLCFRWCSCLSVSEVTAALRFREFGRGDRCEASYSALRFGGFG